jgi:hypothetical protein
MKRKNIATILIIILALTPVLTSTGYAQKITNQNQPPGRYLEVNLFPIIEKGLSIGIEGITYNTGDRTTEKVILTTKIFEGPLSEYSQIELKEYRRTYNFVLEPGQKINCGNYFAHEIVNKNERHKVLYIDFEARSEDYPGDGCLGQYKQEVWVKYINSNIQVMRLPGKSKNVLEKPTIANFNLFKYMVNHALILFGLSRNFETR